MLYLFLHPRGELLSLRDIERLHKKPKSDKETRLATAMVSEACLFLVLSTESKGMKYDSELVWTQNGSI